MRMASPPPLPRIQGVVARAGHTSPPEANCSTASPTPYWKYSTLLGGGRCDSSAEAGFACPKKVNAAAVANAKRPAFLRWTPCLEAASGFEFEAGSTFVVVSGLTVPESVFESRVESLGSYRNGNSPRQTRCPSDATLCARGHRGG